MPWCTATTHFGSEAWVGLFKEIAENLGISVDRNELYGMLYRKALEGKKDCGGMVSYNYVSGEPVTGMMEGRPLFMRMPDTKLNLADFMRTHLYGSLAALKVGLDILLKEEQVTVDKIYGHGRPVQDTACGSEDSGSSYERSGDSDENCR